MNNEPCPNCGEYHCCTELISKQQAEIEALKSDGKVCARCGRTQTIRF